MSLVLDKGHDHAVEVEEEHDQVEAQLGKGFLVAVSLGPSSGATRRRRAGERTFLCTFSFRKISVASRRWVLSTILAGETVSRDAGAHRSWDTYFFAFHASRGRFRMRGSQ